MMAALIFVALPLGVWTSLLPRGEQRSDILFVHKSIGMTILCLAALRIVWRLIGGAPAYAEPLGTLIQAAARAAHMALYALMIAMPVTGYMTSGTGKHDIPWFGLFNFPNFMPANKALEDRAAEAHYVFAWAIAVVLALHLGAVVWHAGVRRDSVLTRMWLGYRPGSESAIP
jgi:cytochrome b561